jgi:hypothetical protein
MAKFDFKMILQYARVFTHNADMGDPDASPKSVAGGIARKGGQTVVNAWFTSEEDLQKLVDSGLELKPMGHPRIKEPNDGDDGYGIGKFLQLKRDLEDNIHVFDNKGKKVEVNYGGLPKIVDLRNPEAKKLWNVDEDGELGNGTEAIVRFETYSRGNGIRLEAIAVEKLVEYTPQTVSEYEDVWDV